MNTQNIFVKVGQKLALRQGGGFQVLLDAFVCFFQDTMLLGQLSCMTYHA